MDIVNSIDDAARDVEGILARAGLLQAPESGSSPTEVMVYMRAVEGMRQAKAVALRNVDRQRLQGSKHAPITLSARPGGGAGVKARAAPRPPTFVSKLKILQAGADSSRRPDGAAPTVTPPKASLPPRGGEVGGGGKPTFVVTTKLFPSAPAPREVKRVLPNPATRASSTMPVELAKLHTVPTIISRGEGSRRVEHLGDESGSTRHADFSRCAAGEASGPTMLPIHVARRRQQTVETHNPHPMATIPLPSSAGGGVGAGSTINVHIQLPQDVVPQRQSSARGTDASVPPTYVVPVMCKMRSGGTRGAPQPAAAPAPIMVPVHFSTRTHRLRSTPEVPPAPAHAQTLPLTPRQGGEEAGTATALSHALQSMWKDVLGTLTETLGALRTQQQPAATATATGSTATLTGMPSQQAASGEPTVPSSQLSDAVLLQIIATSCLQAEQDHGTQESRSLRELIGELRRDVSNVAAQVTEARLDTLSSREEGKSTRTTVTALAESVAATAATVSDMRIVTEQGLQTVQEGVREGVEQLKADVVSTATALADGIHDLDVNVRDTITTFSDADRNYLLEAIRREVAPALNVLAEEVSSLRDQAPAPGQHVDIAGPLAQLQQRLCDEVSAQLSPVALVHSATAAAVQRIEEEVQRLHLELSAFGNSQEPALPARIEAPTEPQTDYADTSSAASETSESSLSSGQVPLHSMPSYRTDTSTAYVAISLARSNTTSRATSGTAYSGSSRSVGSASLADALSRRVTPEGTGVLQAPSYGASAGGIATGASGEYSGARAHMLHPLEELPQLTEVDIAELSMGEVILTEDLSSGELVQLLPLTHTHAGVIAYGHTRS